MTSRKLVPLASIFLVGAAAGGYSPIGCGCLSMNEVVANLVGVTSESDLENPTAVREALNKRFKTGGVKLSNVEQHNCTSASENVVVCRYWLWRKPGFIKSLDITIWVGPNSAYRGSAVAYVEQPTSPPQGT
jgi:hypothetical protein